MYAIDTKGNISGDDYIWTFNPSLYVKFHNSIDDIDEDINVDDENVIKYDLDKGFVGKVKYGFVLKNDFFLKPMPTATKLSLKVMDDRNVLRGDSQLVNVNTGPPTKVIIVSNILPVQVFCDSHEVSYFPWEPLRQISVKLITNIGDESDMVEVEYVDISVILNTHEIISRRKFDNLSSKKKKSLSLKIEPELAFALVSDADFIIRCFVELGLKSKDIISLPPAHIRCKLMCFDMVESLQLYIHQFDDMEMLNRDDSTFHCNDRFPILYVELTTYNKSEIPDCELNLICALSLSATYGKCKKVIPFTEFYTEIEKIEIEVDNVKRKFLKFRCTKSSKLELGTYTFNVDYNNKVENCNIHIPSKFCKVL